jgi:hypothetical protein
MFYNPMLMSSFFHPTTASLNNPERNGNSFELAAVQGLQAVHFTNSGAR